MNCWRNILLVSLLLFMFWLWFFIWISRVVSLLLFIQARLSRYSSQCFWQLNLNIVLINHLRILQICDPIFLLSFLLSKEMTLKAWQRRRLLSLLATWHLSHMNALQFRLSRASNIYQLLRINLHQIWWLHWIKRNSLILRKVQAFIFSRSFLSKWISSLFQLFILMRNLVKFHWCSDINVKLLNEMWLEVSLFSFIFKSPSSSTWKIICLFLFDKSSYIIFTLEKLRKYFSLHIRILKLWFK